MVFLFMSVFKTFVVVALPNFVREVMSLDDMPRKVVVISMKYRTGGRTSRERHTPVPRAPLMWSYTIFSSISMISVL